MAKRKYIERRKKKQEPKKVISKKTIDKNIKPKGETTPVLPNKKLGTTNVKKVKTSYSYTYRKDWSPDPLIFMPSFPVYTTPLVIMPRIWAKMLYMCKKSDTEIGGFGILAPDNPHLIIDFALIKQEVSAASVELDDEALNDYVSEQFEVYNRQPRDCTRVWIHSHPGMDAKPSSIDESKSDGPLGTFTWLATLILSNDEMYSRLRIIDDEYYRYYGLPIHILKGYSITIEDKAEWDKQFLDHVIEDYTYGFYGGYGIGHYPAYHHYGGLYDDDIIDLGHGAAMNALTGEVIERDMIADVEYATEMYELGLDPYDKEDTEWYYTNFYHYVLERDHRERSDFYEPL